MASTETIVIPIEEGVAFFTQRLTLDGRAYNLGFNWSQRESRWYLSISDEENEPIVMSLKLVANWPLLRFYHYDPRVPPGELMAQDLTGNNAPPGFDDFGEGKRVQLLYFAQTES